MTRLLRYIVEFRNMCIWQLVVNAWSMVNPPKTTKPHNMCSRVSMPCRNSVAAGCWFWHHFERLRCCLFFLEKSAVLVEQLLYEAYKLIDIEDRLHTVSFKFTVYRSSLHDQPRIPSQPSAKPWLFWRREAVVRFLKVRWRGWGSCQEQPSSRPAALLQIAELDRLRERGAGGLGWGNTGMRRLQFFFLEDQTMQVYVDFEGSITMASFFRFSEEEALPGHSK